MAAPRAPRKVAPAPVADPARLASALGLPEDRVARALAAAATTPTALLAALRDGSVAGEERLRTAARALRVERARLEAAVLEAGTAASDVSLRAGDAAGALGAVAKGAAEEALALGLEIVGESVPRLVNHTLLVLAATGLALVALGAMALVATSTFVQLLALLAGVALVAAGVAMFTLAWRLHEATATMRLLARMARRYRAGREERGAKAQR